VALLMPATAATPRSHPCFVSPEIDDDIEIEINPRT